MLEMKMIGTFSWVLRNILDSIAISSNIRKCHCSLDFDIYFFAKSAFDFAIT